MIQAGMQMATVMMKTTMKPAFLMEEIAVYLMFMKIIILTMIIVTNACA
jgi:hypothetical protein